MERKYYKICRVKCRRCGNILEHRNRTKADNHFHILRCSCGKVGLDSAAIGYRIVGNPSDYEDFSEEWGLERGEIQSCMQN